jgi:sn-glycerol 3-phosphate transport system substrate-binding protein
MIRLFKWFPFVLLFALVCVACSAPAQPTTAPPPTTATQLPVQTTAPATQPSVSGKVVKLQFIYPVYVTGPMAQVIDGYVKNFNASHPDIQVEAIFAGTYAENMARAQAAISAGQPPDVAILLSTDLYTLRKMDAIIPLDDYINGSQGIDMKDFYKPFMLNTTSQGKVWGISFQRSTPVMYYNKDAFVEVGLDPEKPPKTWDEMVQYAKKLTTSTGGTVTRWGVEVPTDDWIFSSFTMQAGKPIQTQEDDPCTLYINSPEAIQAAEFIRSLQTVHKVMPDGVVKWATAPADFSSGKAAMLYHTTGGLTQILKDAKFKVGTAFLPAGPKGYGVPTGGGLFYIMKGLPKERQDAAWVFIQWMTRPEQLGQWSVDSGYVSPRISSWDVEPLKSYVQKVPQAATARDQLQYAMKEFPSSLEGPAIKAGMVSTLEAIATAQLTPKEALDQHQARANELMKQAGCK